MLKRPLPASALLICISALLILQCDRTYLPLDSSGEINYLQGNTTARVILQLFDRHTSEPLSDAVVTIVGVDSVLSDTTGIVVFDSVPVGDYLVTCSKSGFESIIDYVKLTIDSNSNTVPVVNQSTDIMYMARKGAAVSGNVYYEKGSRKYPVSGATIECQLTNSSLAFRRPLVTTASDDGAYSFDDLPEYSTYTIRVLPFVTGSLTYKQTGTVSVVGQAAGDTQHAQDIILTQFTNGEFIVLDNNLETFTVEDFIMVEFSEAVDTAALGPDSIYVTTSGSTARILVHEVWKDGNTKLQMTPFDGTWSTTQAYTLVIRKIKSVSGKTFNNTEFLSYSFSPATAGELGDVEGLRYRVGFNDTLKVDYNTSSITLLWSKLDNAASYQVYQKTSSDSSWLYLTTVYDTICSSLSTSGRFSNGNYMKFLVLGKNSESVSPFKTATILEVKDEDRPYIYYSSTCYGFNRTSYNYPDTITITVSSSFIPEPMDTTGRPTLVVKEASYLSGTVIYGDTLYAVDPAKSFWTWTSTQTGQMNVVVDPLKNGAYDSLKIDFSSVSDRAGNKAETTGGAGFINYRTLP